MHRQLGSPASFPTGCSLSQGQKPGRAGGAGRKRGRGSGPGEKQGPNTRASFLIFFQSNRLAGEEAQGLRTATKKVVGEQ